jgi:long-chain acyl-CoA synthetase
MTITGLSQQLTCRSAKSARSSPAAARFKRPRAYRFVETLPKNDYGKVLKTELHRLLGTV